MSGAAILPRSVPPCSVADEFAGEADRLVTTSPKREKATMVRITSSTIPMGASSDMMRRSRAPCASSVVTLLSPVIALRPTCCTRIASCRPCSPRLADAPASQHEPAPAPDCEAAEREQCCDPAGHARIARCGQWARLAPCGHGGVADEEVERANVRSTIVKGHGLPHDEVHFGAVALHVHRHGHRVGHAHLP